MGFFKNLKTKMSKKTADDKVVKEIETKRKQENYHTGLKKSRGRESFVYRLQKLSARHREVNEVYFEELEEILVMSDISVDYVIDLIEILRTDSKVKKITDSKHLTELLFENMFALYLNKKDDTDLDINLNRELNIVLVTGVNGSGKTTSIGKIAHKYKQQGYKILLAAADTFRAGAVLQLEKWATKNEVDIVIPKKDGQDPASVVYEAVHRAQEGDYNLLIIDTAGRLQNKKNLMKELEKINRLIIREANQAPNESLLVIDATTGQNGVSQAKEFNEVTDISGIILTKMDSSSKGGIILSIKSSFNIPVKLIGLGEAIDDLEEFDLTNYLGALTSDLMKDYEVEGDY